MRGFRVARRAIAAAACVALGLALFMPAVRAQREKFDWLAVVDITQSMNVLDYRIDGAPTSRLMFAKRALRDALPRLPCGSTMGLAVFSEYRTFVLFTPVEVCRNQADILAAIDALSGRMAWANASQIARGLYGGLRIAKELPGRPALAFVTDGHEAPPLNAKYRPEFDGRSGEVPGVIVGAGGPIAEPIPKIGPDGNAQGFWSADEVLQTDLYTRGRSGSVSGEQMIETGPPAPPLPQDQPARSEHLSALHEQYLKLLASETGLQYRRLISSDTLAKALTNAAFARHQRVLADMRWGWGVLALLALVIGSIPLQNG